MVPDFKITNRELFTESVESIDISDLVSEGEDIFSGQMCIYLKEDKAQPYYGLIRYDDFEKDYGFVLTPLAL